MTPNIDIISSLLSCITIPGDKRDEVISYTKKFIWKSIKESLPFFIMYVLFPCLLLSITLADLKIQPDGVITPIATLQVIAMHPKYNNPKYTQGVQERTKKLLCQHCGQMKVIIPTIEWVNLIPEKVNICEDCIPGFNVSRM
jgi:hypothetical protein